MDKKVRRGIEVIETNIDFLSSSNTQVLNLADISIIILLGTIKRNSKSNYDIFSDNLNDWFNQMSERESVKRTKPPNL